MPILKKEAPHTTTSHALLEGVLQLVALAGKNAFSWSHFSLWKLSLCIVTEAF